MTTPTETPTTAVLDAEEPASSPASALDATRATGAAELSDVVDRFRQERKARLDLVVPTTGIELYAADDEVRFRLTSFATEADDLVDRSFGITDVAHGQIASKTEIPKRYYDRMRADLPGLAVENVNAWWNAEPATRLVRILDPAAELVPHIGAPRLRAFLSDYYRVLDNLDFAEVALEEAVEAGAEVRRCHADDRRLFVKLLLPERSFEIGGGDRVFQGILLRNSEVGFGKIQVLPFVSTLSCQNDVVWGDATERGGFEQVHRSGRYEEGILSPETVEAESETIWMKVRDYVRYALDPENAERIAAAFRRSRDVRIEDVEAKVAVANVVRSKGLTRPEADSVLDRYLRQNDDSQYGMVNAVTYVAHARGASFDRAIELETIGGELLAAESSAFRRIVESDLDPESVESAFSAN